MLPRRPAPYIVAFAALLAMAAQAFAADLPLKPAPRSHRASTPAASAKATPLASPNATCQEWTDGCRVCQREPNGEASCSNVGIACVPKAEECTRP